MRQPRAWGWWRYTTARQARFLTIGWLGIAAMVVFTGLTTQAGSGFAVVALAPAAVAASWASQWNRARQGATPSPAQIPAEPTGSQKPAAASLYRLILASPRNAAIYGLIVGVFMALFALAVFGVLQATAGASSAMLIPVVIMALLLGPLGGVLGYYFGPHPFRDQGK